jgi:hypothetical protein
MGTETLGPDLPEGEQELIDNIAESPLAMQPGRLGEVRRTVEEVRANTPDILLHRDLRTKVAAKLVESKDNQC